MSFKVKTRSIRLRVIGTEELPPEGVFANLQVVPGFTIDDALAEQIRILAFGGHLAPPGLPPVLVGGLDEPQSGRIHTFAVTPLPSLTLSDIDGSRISAHLYDQVFSPSGLTAAFSRISASLRTNNNEVSVLVVTPFRSERVLGEVGTHSTGDGSDTSPLLMVLRGKRSLKSAARDLLTLATLCSDGPAPPQLLLQKRVIRAHGLIG